MEILIKRLREDVKLPTYTHVTDPGISLFAGETVTLASGERKLIGTGIAMAIPIGYVGLIWHKDGVPNLSDVTIKAMVVDSGFRKELVIKVKNHSDETIEIPAGACIAQMLIQKIEQPRLIEAEDLSEAAEDVA
jgi:dUTP pyrophosphatase